MTEHQSNRSSPEGAACQLHEDTSAVSASQQTKTASQQTKVAARETTDELRRKGAEMAHETKESARQLKDEAIHSATEAARQAQQQAVGYADQQKGRVADELRTFGQAISRAADKLREDDDTRAASYAAMAADQLTSAADYLRNRELGSLMEDVESFARRRPEIFFGGTFLVGMGIARFLKASGRRRVRHDSGHYQQGPSQHSPTSRGPAHLTNRPTSKHDEPASSQPLRSRPQHESSLSGMNDPLSYH